jgi:hypothetical protein
MRTCEEAFFRLACFTRTASLHTDPRQVRNHVTLAEIIQVVENATNLLEMRLAKRA